MTQWLGELPEAASASASGFGNFATQSLPELRQLKRIMLMSSIEGSSKMGIGRKRLGRIGSDGALFETVAPASLSRSPRFFGRSTDSIRALAPNGLRLRIPALRLAHCLSVPVLLYLCRSCPKVSFDAIVVRNEK